MNLGELEAEIDAIVKDDSLADNYTAWINQAIGELSLDYDLPALRLIEPVALPVTTVSWVYDLEFGAGQPVYQKKLFQARSGNYGEVGVLRDIDELHVKDIDHDETGDRVLAVGVQDRQIGVWPKANDTLYLWFYKRATPLKDPDDPVTCIPEEYQARVIIPKLVVKNFVLLQDMVIDPPHQSILFWQNELRAGLFGRAGGDVGLINYLVRARGVRRHGGRDPLP